MANEEKKKPKEASNIFHSIMKASVTPKQITEETDKMIEDVRKELNDAKAKLESEKKARSKTKK